ncbi:MAG: tetratricopeptide repeat protein [Deltaproteobacteria bacterium]|nr:tetratricopeptide repeat protein [Deltaproteobacteria bacterium]
MIKVNYRRDRRSMLPLSLVLLLCAACGNDAQTTNNTGSSGGAGISDGSDMDASGGPLTDESINTPPPALPPTSPVDAGGPVDSGGSATNNQAGRPPAPPPRPTMSAGARDSYRSGLAAAQQGNLQAARDSFERALGSDPQAFQAAYNAGVIAERMGQDAPADSFYQRALTIQPDYEVAMAARARLLVRQRRVPDAVAFVSDIARRYPGNFLVRAEYARLLVIAERYDQAVDEARAILRFDERNVAAKIAVAEAFRARGRTDNALYIIDELINGSDPQHPNNGPGAGDARAHYLRALLRVEVNRDVPGAIQSFSRAVELDPQFAEAHNNLGVYLLQAGNVSTAIEHLRAATALSPSWAKAHLNLGDALRALHTYDEATTELQRALQLDATLFEVHYNMGRLHGEQARELASTGLDNINRKLALLQQSQQDFQRYRDALGPSFATHPRASDVGQQLERLTSLITRTTTLRDREQRRLARQSAQATPAAGAADAGAPAAGDGG